MEFQSIHDRTQLLTRLESHLGNTPSLSLKSQVHQFLVDNLNQIWGEVATRKEDTIG